jgi:hypothetical protein
VYHGGVWLALAKTNDRFSFTTLCSNKTGINNKSLIGFKPSCHLSFPAPIPYPLLTLRLRSGQQKKKKDKQKIFAA